MKLIATAVKKQTFRLLAKWELIMAYYGIYRISTGIKCNHCTDDTAAGDGGPSPAEFTLFGLSHTSPFGRGCWRSKRHAPPCFSSIIIIILYPPAVAAAPTGALLGY